MSALTDFLLARITGDEDQVRDAADDSAIPADCWPAERILAECAAKREQIAQIITLRIESGRIARAMATVWADHPDYDLEWRL
ncbi:hypothetical protein GCM10009616_35950 [Microlunatus lacustris]